MIHCYVQAFICYETCYFHKFHSKTVICRRQIGYLIFCFGCQQLYLVARKNSYTTVYIQIQLLGANWLLRFFCGSQQFFLEVSIFFRSQLATMLLPYPRAYMRRAFPARLRWKRGMRPIAIHVLHWVTPDFKIFYSNRGMHAVQNWAYTREDMVFLPAFMLFWSQLETYSSPCRSLICGISSLMLLLLILDCTHT